MTEPQRSPLTLAEATALLQELDRQRAQRRITGIAYRTGRESVLARIADAGPQRRYVTRRQVRAPVQPAPPAFDANRARLAQEALDARRDEASDDFVTLEMEESDEAVNEVPQLPVETAQEREERERAEHFRAVTIVYRPMFPERQPRTLDIDFVGPAPSTSAAGL